MKNNHPTTLPLTQNQTVIWLDEVLHGQSPMYNIALVFEQTELTCRELNAPANGVAHYLRDRRPIQPDGVIALQLERGEWMVVAILSVWKAGAAYLPIAPDAPTGRVRYMLEDGRAKALLTDEAAYTTVKAASPFSAHLCIDGSRWKRPVEPIITSLK